MRSNKTSVSSCSKRMHPLFEKASGLTEAIIAGATEVHRDKGPRPDRIHLQNGVSRKTLGCAA